MRRAIALLLATLTGCAGSSTTGDGGGPCGYPAGATEPMAVGSVITPYSWPAALEADRTARSLDLGEIHCDADADIDWSPFDMLLFVSIPAW